MIKKILQIILFALLTVVVKAQSPTDITLKFLGFPVDGSKQEMIANLRSKGFSYNSYGDYLTGQFNGERVRVLIHTNHDIVDRIYVEFPSTTSASEIKNRYNRLISQFDNNDNYVTAVFGGNKPIPSDENIYYEMSVKDKYYQAGYHYTAGNNLEKTIDQLTEFASSMLPEEEAEVFVSTVFALLNNPNEENTLAFQQQMRLLGDAEWTPEKAEQFSQIANAMNELESAAEKGRVWFTIDYNEGKYNIDLFYDNLSNQAHGEDL